MARKIAVASDHAGYDLKSSVIEYLKSQGGVYEIKDMGTGSSESCDYPDYALPAARAVSEGKCDAAILICGSGIGMSITANKFKGVRAALACDVERARLSRLHNDANILCMGARFTDAELARQMVKVFLETPFEGGRHARRVEKIASLESGIRKLL